MQPVRRLSTALLLVSTAALARVGPQNVRIANPSLRFVSSEHIAEACGTGRPVDACTQLDELKLTCECGPADRGWSTHSEFSAVARVMLTDSGYLTHENGHVQDFRSLIGEYLTEVDAARYDSLASCRSAAVSVQATFAARLDGIRRISAFRRDHTPMAGSVKVRYEAGSVEVVSNEPAAAAGGGSPAIVTIVSDDWLEPYLEPRVMP